MKINRLLIIVFVCSLCSVISAQTHAAVDSVVVVMKDGTVHKFDKTKKGDSDAYSGILKKQSADIKQSYGVNESGVFYVIPDKMPVFKGGQEGLMSYLSKNVMYPNEAIKQKVQETIIVRFFIEEDGTVSKTNVLQGKNELLRNEAERVVVSMPKWKPGEVAKKPVRTVFTLPIRFALQ